MPTAMIQSLLLAFLPILVYILAEELLGMIWGLVVAILSGLIEMLVSYVKERKLETMILLDIGLLLVFGLVSVGLQNDLFFKLKPAILQLVFIILLGITIYTPHSILLKMGARYLKNLSITPDLEHHFKRSLSPIFYLLIVHTLLIVYAAFYMSTRWWGFISGVLLYILLGIYFAVPLLLGIVRRRRSSSQEWFDVVDPEGRVIGQATRQACHSNRNLLHPVVHLHVLDGNHRLYLQKRSPAKEIQPDKWDTAVGGHIQRGESVESALKREAEEELGLIRFPIIPLIRYVMTSPIESELVYVFKTHYHDEITVNPDEISEGRFWEMEEIQARLEEDLFTPNFRQEFKMLMELNLL